MLEGQIFNPIVLCLLLSMKNVFIFYSWKYRATLKFMIHLFHNLVSGVCIKLKGDKENIETSSNLGDTHMVIVE